MAGEICTGVVTNVANTLVGKAMKEAKYLCCYQSYVDDFKSERTRLSARVKSVLLDIEEAKKRNEDLIEPDVQQWLDEADSLEKLDIEAKKCLLGLCTNCTGQYGRGKELESKKQGIQKLIEKSYNFPRVARSTGLPGMEYYSQNFMNFESRKSKFEELKEVLKDDNNYMIGLQGMGGTGKTTMAIEVGREVENSKRFDKVIFVVVSNPADEKKIRGVIAKRLELQLKEEEESIHAEQVWTRIANVGKVLIILDDVWEVLNLKNIGIQTGPHHKGCCSVLLTTRDHGVCARMECQETIQLEVLSVDDALNLFLFHVGRSGNHCSHDLKHVELDIVKESGRLPIAVVAVAKMLKTWPPNDWQAALTKLKNPKPLHKTVDEGMTTKVYNSLRLSYDNLKNKEAQYLFLLCSFFPEDCEIPIEFLNKIAIGSGLFGEVEKYNMARSQVITIKNELINSSLLLRTEEDCVKMHDLVREVALWIATEEIQAVMDSKTSLKENVRYSYWDINDFPDCVDGSKLEVLLINIVNCFGKVPDAFFERMINLKVLVLSCEENSMQISASLLFQPIQSLRNVRTLLIRNWLLGDISILKNLKNLETLELNSCSIIELPNEVKELEKLRLLGLKRCSIEKNNPFEVIGKCSQIEELYYVCNVSILSRRVKLPQITTLPELQRCHIVGGIEDYDEVDISTERYFAPGPLKRIFSKEIFKSLVATAEVLLLREYNETGWTNLIPDIIPMEDGGMNNLITLSLEAWSEIKCLIQTEHLQASATIFSKLVKLRLYLMDVEKLCCGPFPIDFLKQLTVLDLQECLKLESTLFKGKLDLGNLKSIHLASCSIACVFQYPSTAQSLKQLETLEIFKCDKLKYIMKDEGSGKEKVDDHDPNQKSHGSMLPKLKFLEVQECHELEFILPICFGEDLPLLERMRIYYCEKLKYIFGQYPEEGDLYQMGKVIILPSLKEMEIDEVPKFINIYPECYLPFSFEVQKSSPSDGSKVKEESLSNSFSWASLCCFLPKSCATCVDDPSISKTTQPDQTASRALKIEHTARSLFTAPLYPHNLREMKIKGYFNLTSFFTLSIASSMSSLEILEVENYDGLKHIVTHEGIGHDHNNCSCVFPKLQIMRLKHLLSLRNFCQGIDSQMLENRVVRDCPKISLASSPHSQLQDNEGQEASSERELPQALKMELVFNTAQCFLIPPLYPHNLREMRIMDCSNLVSLFTLSVASSMLSLERLKVKYCDGLKHIIIDEGDGHDHMNCISIFPNLREVAVSSCMI